MCVCAREGEGEREKEGGGERGGERERACALTGVSMGGKQWINHTSCHLEMSA